MAYTLKEVSELWRQAQCSDAEYALFFFIYMHLKRHPHKRLQNAFDTQFNHLPFTSDILDRFQFKKVRQKAISTLKMWTQNQWPIRLVTRPLDALEILQDQAQGVRAVSLILQEQPTPIFHRVDAFDFFIHDLEHGFLFFSNPELHVTQVRFFEKLHQTCQPNLATSI